MLVTKYYRGRLTSWLGDVSILRAYHYEMDIKDLARDTRLMVLHVIRHQDVPLQSPSKPNWS